MKRWIKGCISLVMAATLVLGSAVMASAAETSEVQKAISVSGQGIVKVDPDLASIYMEVRTEANTAQEAQDKNKAIVAKSEEALLKAGIAKEDIVTRDYSVYPRYQYDKDTGERTMNGYQAINSFEVRTQDIENVGVYIQAATGAGVTGFNGVSFSLKDPNRYYAEALRAAMGNARSTAVVIADTLGVSLGQPLNVTEQPNYASYAVASMSRGQYDAKEEVIYGGGNPVEIRYEQLEVTAQVTVTYQHGV